MSWAAPYQPPAQPYVPPCVVLIDPDSEFKRCGGPAGEHTILDWPLCDKCFEAICL